MCLDPARNVTASQLLFIFFFFFKSRRGHTRSWRDWSSDVCSSDLFLSGELPFRGSVEGGYVSMARFLSQHPNPWGWNPFPYCGLPVQFMYVPALPYLSALGIRLLPHVSPDLVFRTI